MQRKLKRMTKPMSAPTPIQRQYWSVNSPRDPSTVRPTVTSGGASGLKGCTAHPQHAYTAHQGWDRVI